MTNELIAAVMVIRANKLEEKRQSRVMTGLARLARIKAEREKVHIDRLANRLKASLTLAISELTERGIISKPVSPARKRIKDRARLRDKRRQKARLA